MTVSNAYNRPEKLSPELRERILAKADELGYAGPNVLARSLRRGRTGVLGVVLGEALSYAFEDPGAIEFLRGLRRAAASRCTSSRPPAARATRRSCSTPPSTPSCSTRCPTGTRWSRRSLRRRLPVIVQSGPAAATGHPLVAIDERAAAAAAADAPPRARPHAAGACSACRSRSPIAPTGRCAPRRPRTASPAGGSRATAWASGARSSSTTARTARPRRARCSTARSRRPACCA